MKPKQLWRKVAINLLNLFLPQFCLGCQREGTLLCADCLSLIKILEFDYCPFCLKPKRVFEKGKCPKHSRKNLEGIFAAVSYEDPLVKKLIARFKYEPFLKELSKPLAYLIIAHFLLSKNKKIVSQSVNAVFVPVPLFSRRQRWRGYNQSEEIAKILSETYKIPLVTDALVKPKKTKSQVELPPAERWENVKNSFFVKKNNLIKNKIVYLIDDVFTTGATMEACAAVLKAGGAKEVWGIVIAREIAASN